MRFPLRAVLVSFAASGLAAQLTVDDVVDLQRAMLPDGAPVTDGWIDGDHLAVWMAADGWRRVDARSGEHAALLDRARFHAALVARSGAADEAAAAVVGSRSALTWGPGYRGAVFSLGGDLYRVDAATAAVTRLTDAAGDELEAEESPDGAQVAFVRDHDLYVVPAAGGDERRLTTGGSRLLRHARLDWVYQEELYGRGNFKAFWWSPDSERIALLRLDESAVPEFTLVSDAPTRPKVEVEQYPKAGDGNPKVAVGVVAAAGGAPRWFDLSAWAEHEPLVSRVCWHPDGEEVWFQVQDRAQRWLELVAGDVASGTVRTVLREESDCWVESLGDPAWLGGGAEFLWRSERDGFAHVYRYRRDGELVSRLTEGAWEVDDIVAVDESGAGTAWLLCDRDDVREQQLWAMALDGTIGRQVTRSHGNHAVRMAPGCGLFLDTWSAIDQMRRVDVCGADDGDAVHTVAEADMLPFVERAPCPVEFHQVPTRDGFVMQAMLIKPRDMQPDRRYPTVCYVYAGPHAQQVRNAWGGRRFLWHQLLAQQGFLVWVCDNRSASGRGRASASACYRRLGQTELADLEDAARWLVAHGPADPERLAIWGWSYGGYQTCFNLTHSSVWKVGVAVNPVTDWRFYDSIYTERYMDLPARNPLGYDAGSAVAAAGDLSGDLLLVHATMDDNVHMQNSLAFAHALQQAGRPFTFLPYPRVRHGIEDDAQQKHLYASMTRFLRERL